MVSAYADLKMLPRALPLLVHEQFAQFRDLPKNKGKVVKFRRYGAFTPSTTPLTPGVTPAGQDLSVTDITVTINQYGNFTILTDEVTDTTLEDVVGEAAEVLGDEMGQVGDIVVRSVLVSGTSVTRAGARATIDLVQSGDIATEADYRKIVRGLKNENAKRITSFVKPDQGYGTSPVAPAFVAIVHPNTSYTFDDSTKFPNFVRVEKYQNQTQVMPGEIGKLFDLRFIETTYASVVEDSGVGGLVDVYQDIILGKDAYGVTRLGKEGPKSYYKGFGSAGSADPIDQRSTLGWKMWKAAKILNDNWMERYEHSVEA